MINIIVAMSKNRVIGNDNSLIWRLSSDLKRFKELTTGNTIVMGRKTYESIGKPLPNRRNIIVTRDLNFRAEGCEVVQTIEKLLNMYDYDRKGQDFYIIGGGEIYARLIDICDKIYLTLVDETFEGDTSFPEIGEEWIEVDRKDHQSDEKNQYNYSFINYEKCDF